MDPISQAAFGALWAQAGSIPENKSSSEIKNHRKAAAAAGALAGMAPDLDVLIRSSQDHLLALDFHRHFTHAIPFAPMGGLIVSAALYPLFKRHFSFVTLYLLCFLGYLSHGLLDSFTSYGTSLSWPFNDHRAALNWISVIDPLFTLPLIALLVMGFKKGRWMAFAGLWAAAYLGLGGWQHHRAEQVVSQWTAQANISAQRIVAKPAFANILLWRGLVDDGGQLHTLAIRLPLFGSPQWLQGASVERLNPTSVATAGTTLHRDLQRFAHFSDHWLFRYAPNEDTDHWFVGDFRYALEPSSERPLWGIRFQPQQADAGVEFQRLRQIDTGERQRFWEQLRGEAF